MCSDGRYIAWAEFVGNFNPDDKLYLYDTREKETLLIDTGISFFDFTGDKLVYTKDEDLYAYDLTNKEKACITADQDEYFFGFNCHKDRIVCSDDIAIDRCVILVLEAVQ